MIIVLKVIFVAIAVVAPFLMFWSVRFHRKTRDELTALAGRLCDPGSWTVAPAIDYLTSRQIRWQGRLTGRVDGHAVRISLDSQTLQEMSLWVGCPVKTDLEIESRFNTPKNLDKSTADILEKIYSTRDFNRLRAVSSKVSHQRLFLFYPGYLGDDPGIQLERRRAARPDMEIIRRDIALVVELCRALNAAPPETAR